MTELTIVPNLDRKSLKLHGAIAAGEHVKVTVVGGADWVSPDGETQTLRLRFIFCDRVVAVFPTVTVADVSADDTGTLTPQDITAWHTSADDAEIAEGDAVCELNLNTTTAEKYLKFGGMCLVVLDDPYGNTLYGSGESDAEGDTVYGTADCEVLPWPMRDVVEVPQNLDGVPPINVRKYLATWTGYDSSANTEIEIEPNYAKKSLKFRGAVASGEHVRVTVKGAAEWANAEGAELRLRVIFGCKQVAMFPIITTADVAADTTNTLTGEDVMEWDTTDGENAVCMLNLNTVPAEKYLKFGGTCLWILDDRANHTLYATGEFDVMPWPKRNGADVPYNLDEYPDIVAELQEAWAAYQTELNAAWEAHQQEVATAIASKANALDLTSHVGNTSNPHSVTKAQVGLGNVDNTADADKPISTAVQAALDGKQPVIQDLADIRSGAAAGATALHEHQDISGKADKSATYTKSEVDNLVASATPGDYDSLKGRVSAVESKVPSAASASNQLADKAYVGTEILSAIDAVTDGAPMAFDTLKEIADWIGDEGSGAQQVIDQVANKVDKETGKGLSTNDFTTAEKEKLAGIAAGATAVTVDSALSGSSANPVENRAVSEALAGKFDKADEDVQVSFDDENMGLKVADYADLYHVVLHIKGIIANWADGNDKKFLFPSHPPSNKTTLALLQNIAPDFSTSASYAVDDLCVRSGQLFRCTAAHAPDDWNFDHFQPATVQDVLASLCSVVAARPTKTSDLQNDGDGTSPFAKVSQLPTVPANVSAFANDAGYVTSEELEEAIVGAIDDAGSMDEAKADKAVPSVAGNLASLTTDGNLMDSGKRPSDFAPSSDIQKSALASDVQASLGLADSALQVPQELVYEDGSWHADSLLDDEEHDVRVVEVVSGPTYHDGYWTAQFLYNNGVTQQLAASGAEDATELRFGPNGTTAVFSRVPAGYVLREPTRSRSRSAAEPAKVQPAGFYADRSEMSVTAGTGEDADKATIQLKDGLSATVLTQHQDISGKADASAVYTKSEIDDMFDDLTYTPISISSFTVSPSSAEKGSTVSSVTLSYTLSKAAESATLDGSAVALSGKTGTISRTGLSLTSDKTWTLSVTDRGSASESPHSASRGATLGFYWKRHWGVAADATPDAAFILGLASCELASSRGKTFTVIAGSGQYIWYAYPKSWDAASFKVGGFDGGFQLVGTVNHVNASGGKAEYYVYRSDNPSLGATTVVVS